MKNYILNKINFLNLNMKEIIYDFKVQHSNEPTNWIKIIIHHTSNSNTIQKIINLHVMKNQWSSIGYHFLIGKNGQIYYSRKLNTAGAHCYGYNRNSIGIALFGNFDNDEPTEKQIISLKKLISSIKNKYEIRKILGHNQAIYKIIKEKFYRINLPQINPIEIDTKLSYDTFRKQITEKVLEFDANKSTVDLIKRFKTCPGFYMYKYLKEIEK